MSLVLLDKAKLFCPTSQTSNLTTESKLCATDRFSAVLLIWPAHGMFPEDVISIITVLPLDICSLPA